MDVPRVEKEAETWCNIHNCLDEGENGGEEEVEGEWEGGGQQRGVVLLRLSRALSSLRSFDQFSFCPTQANFSFKKKKNLHVF